MSAIIFRSIALRPWRALTFLTFAVACNPPVENSKGSNQSATGDVDTASDSAGDSSSTVTDTVPADTGSTVEPDYDCDLISAGAYIFNNDGSALADEVNTVVCGEMQAFEGVDPFFTDHVLAVAFVDNSAAYCSLPGEYGCVQISDSSDGYIIVLDNFYEYYPSDLLQVMDHQMAHVYAYSITRHGADLTDFLNISWDPTYSYSTQNTDTTGSDFVTGDAARNYSEDWAYGVEYYRNHPLSFLHTAADSADTQAKYDFFKAMFGIEYLTPFTTSATTTEVYRVAAPYYLYGARLFETTDGQLGYARISIGWDVQDLEAYTVDTGSGTATLAQSTDLGSTGGPQMVGFDNPYLWILQGSNSNYSSALYSRFNVEDGSMVTLTGADVLAGVPDYNSSYSTNSYFQVGLDDQLLLRNPNASTAQMQYALINADGTVEGSQLNTDMFPEIWGADGAGANLVYPIHTETADYNYGLYEWWLRWPGSSDLEFRFAVRGIDVYPMLYDAEHEGTVAQDGKIYFNFWDSTADARLLVGFDAATDTYQYASSPFAASVDLLSATVAGGEIYQLVQDGDELVIYQMQLP